MLALKNIAGWMSIIGAVGFVFIVVMLQLLQSNYDPARQLMSELALGQYGSFMIFAFFSFAISLFGLQFGLRINAVSVFLRILIVIAAISLIGAGVFRLDNAMELHISLVALAFILLGLVMYLLPGRAGKLNSRSLTIFSWGLGISAVLSVALGQSIIPMGVAQRLATIFILIWLFWLGWKIARI